MTPELLTQWQEMHLHFYDLKIEGGTVCVLCHLLLALREAQAETERLQRWVNDLQAGMYINCVYCGHQYGPNETTPQSVVGTTPTMAEVLKQHIEQCPKHPMSALRQQLAEVHDD